MLNGIGGRTVAEAKERISAQEFSQWCAYIRKRGALNIGTRVELGFALLASTVVRANGGKAKIEDFLPQRDEPANTDDLQGILAMLKAKAAETNAARPRRRPKRRK